MAKIVHNNFVDTINDILSQAKQKEVLKLESHSDVWTGRHLNIGNRELVNFGTCGYLGLETHPKLIEGARSYASRYGTQFSVSRTYVTSSANIELEERLSEIFDGLKTIAFSSTSLAHIAIMPIVMNPEDAIILDQQAHVSMQTAAQLMAPKGVPIEIIRHSNLEMLERQIQSLRDKHSRIWYVIDGVYSMYGDIAPIEELNALAKKYDQLHFYVDDAHGMSWTGKNGSGCVFESLKKNGKTILVTTMAKGFGSIGGIVVFPDGHWYDRVILHGGPLAYSHPIAPAVMGASMASADIHMSSEIVHLQQELKIKLDYCNALLENSNLPIISSPRTPIYFVGTGQPNVGYIYNKRILDEGFYVSIGMFPAVPVKNTGLRFTMTNHVNMSEIKAFVEALIYHYPKALEEGGKTLNDVRKAFRLTEVIEKNPVEMPIQKNDMAEVLVTKYYKSISEIDENLWNRIFKDEGNFDWSALNNLEKSFSGNLLLEHNWDFHYFLIFEEEELVLATFFTSGIFKDDLLASVEISKAVEEKRQLDPYYLCSNTLTMGSLFTEGNHLYLARSNKNWKTALSKLIAEIYKIQDRDGINNLIFRDFESKDEDVAEILRNSGFFRIKMPNTNIIHNLQLKIDQDYLEQLSPRSRKNIRYDVIKYYDQFSDEIKDTVTSDELDKIYSLYQNVARNNLALNIFEYPAKLFASFQECDNWEFFILRDLNQNIVGAIASYKNNKTYCPTVIGIDYAYAACSIYKQIMYRVVVSARNRGYERLLFGLSADVEKRKLGADQVEKVAFVNMYDQFNLESLELSNFRSEEIATFGHNG